MSSQKRHRGRVQGAWAASASPKKSAVKQGIDNKSHKSEELQDSQPKDLNAFVFKDPKVHKMSGPSKKPFNFSWFIPGVLAGSGLPSDPAHVQFFLNEGIKHLVSLTEWKPALHLYPGLNHVHMAVREFEPPSVKQIHDFVTIAESAREKHEPVCVHCHWGLGRTGTMLACFLIKTENIAPEDAIKLVRNRRKYSIETYEQENVIHQYAAYLQQAEK